MLVAVKRLYFLDLIRVDYTASMPNRSGCFYFLIIMDVCLVLMDERFARPCSSYSGMRTFSDAGGCFYTTFAY